MCYIYGYLWEVGIKAQWLLKGWFTSLKSVVSLRDSPSKAKGSASNTKVLSIQDICKIWCNGDGVGRLYSWAQDLWRVSSEISFFLSQSIYLSIYCLPRTVRKIKIWYATSVLKVLQCSPYCLHSENQVFITYRIPLLPEIILINMCVCVCIYIYIYICIFLYLVFYIFVCAQSYMTLCNPMNCSPPDSSVYGIFQARIMEWVAISLEKWIIYIKH